MSDEVTLVIPSFRREGCLIKTIRSTQRISSHIKIIIVDDSGQPNTPDIVYDRDRVRLELMPFDSGLSAKRNRGVLLADTQYVAICDDDTDWVALDPNRLINELRGVDFLCCDRGLKASIVMAGDGFPYWVQREHARDPKGRPLYHYVHNYLFGLRSSFIRNPWAEELKVGEHMPWAYLAYLKGLKIAASKHIEAKNVKSVGNAFYNAMRDRAEAFRQDWFHRNTPWGDIERKA